IPTSIYVIPVVPAEVPIAPADPLVTPKVGVVSVISPTEVLDLVGYSFSCDYDPLEDSLHLAPKLPLVSPFLCFDDTEANSESEPADQRPKRHESLTPSSEFPLAPVVSPPRIRRRPALAWRRVSHRSLDHHPSPDFTSDSASFGSSSDSSSDISLGSSSDLLSDSSSVHFSGYDASESSLDSSSERPLGSSLPSAGPSCKRCRSSTTLVPSSTPISRSIAPTYVDLLPPRKRFRDSYSSEASEESIC
nr:hypothetical protein [Tanacetum cinerariifolium]